MLHTLRILLLKICLTIPLLCHIEKYPLNIQLKIEDVFFRNNYIFFVEKNKVKIFNSQKRKFLLPINKPSNSSISLTGNSFLICEWENYEIENMEEYSTKIWVYRKGKKDEAEVLRFHQTVKPINCSIEVLFLETSLPQLEKKYFEYDFEEDKMLEINKQQDTKVIDFWRNEYGNILVKRDMSNILWVYALTQYFW